MQVISRYLTAPQKEFEALFFAGCYSPSKTNLTIFPQTFEVHKETKQTNKKNLDLIKYSQHDYNYLYFFLNSKIEVGCEYKMTKAPPAGRIRDKKLAAVFN